MFSPVAGDDKELTKCWRCDSVLEEQFSKRNILEVVTGLIRVGDSHSSVKVRNYNPPRKSETKSKVQKRSF